AVAPGVPLCGRDDEVRILRIDEDLVDLRRLVEADVRPRLAGVGGLVHAVTERALHRVAAARIDDVRIGGRNLDRADAGDVSGFVEHREPRGAGARALPDAAGGHAHL